jgi:hypothetical protein
MPGDRLICAATAAMVIAVASFAAVVSYSHIYDLGRLHGQDGTAGTAAAAVGGRADPGRLAGAAARGPQRALSASPGPVRTVAGVRGTIAANGASGWPYGPVGVVLST